MKRRGWRVALTVATIGLALVAGLVALNWATVRDHAEAWWFVLTRDTKTLVPDRDSTTSDTWDAFIQGYQPDLLYKFAPETFLQVVANHCNRRFLIDANYWVNPWTISFRHNASPERLLRANGLRFVEQRFPHRAYVLIGWESR